MTSLRIQSLAQMAAVAALVGLLLGCNNFGDFGPLHKEIRTTNIAYQEGAAIEVDTANGSLTMIQTDREDVQIVAHLRAVSAERLEAMKVVADRDENGVLSVSVDWPEGRRFGREGCSFEILIPDAEGVTLRTRNGKINLSGLKGKAELNTRNGAVEVKAHDGPLDATTSNGRIEIAGATSRVDANTSNGAIDVSFTSEGTGPIEARTKNGAIKLNLSPVMQGRLTLKTSNGSLRVDPDCEAKVVSKQKNQVVLDLGDSGNPSNATTSNGSIHVKRAEGGGQ